MHELRIILSREFRERVRTRSFVLSTLLTPVFILLIMLGPLFAEQLGGGRERTLALVDESGEGVGAEMAAALASSDSDGSRTHVQLISGSAFAVEDSLSRAVMAEQLDGFIVVPRDIVQGGALHFRARSITDTGLQRRLGQTATAAVQARRLEIAGIDPALLSAVMSPVQVQAARIADQGEQTHDPESGILLSLMVGFALYMLILLYGVQVLQSVQEEKTNRISEILVSSIRASHLMLGKVLGVGMAAGLQVAIWVSVAVIAARSLGAMLADGDGEATMLAGIMAQVEPALVLSVLGFLLLGFLLYASLFAAAGAAAASSEDAQRFTFPLIMPLIVPMMMTVPIISAPADPLAVVLSWIPFTMPLAMPMRIGAGGAGGVEVALSLAALALSVLVLGVIAGKIYRIGILSTGKRPTLGELIRWIRTA